MCSPIDTKVYGSSDYRLEICMFSSFSGRRHSFLISEWSASFHLAYADRCMSQGREICTGPICFQQVDLSHQNEGRFNQIYLAKWDSNFVWDNKLCLCSFHCTSQSLIKVNKLFIYGLFSRNVIWQNASLGSRSQMHRLSRWQGASLQSKWSCQVCVEGGKTTGLLHLAQSNTVSGPWADTFPWCQLHRPLFVYHCKCGSCKHTTV